MLILGRITKRKQINSTAEQPTHQGPAPTLNTHSRWTCPPRNTFLLIADLPHPGAPYSPWTFPTTEHPTHRGPAPPRNTLLIMDLPNRGTPYSSWTFPTAEHPTHLDLPHRVTPYSPGPTLYGTPYSLNRRRPSKKIATDGTTTNNTQTL